MNTKYLWIIPGFITVVVICVFIFVQQRSTEQITGVWLWGSTVRENGAETIAEKLHKYNFNTVFLLVKGKNGIAEYQSNVALECIPERDVLKEMIDACKQNGIRVHAWIVVNTDAKWISTHPDDAVYHTGNPVEGKPNPYPVEDRVCPLSEEYRHYIKSIIREIISRYEVDGIQLDYIRYPQYAYCFCPEHYKKAKNLGINIENVRNAIRKTEFDVNKDPQYYFNQYRAGDPDITKWVTMRIEEITSFVKEVKALIDSSHKAVKLSSALMPEGGEIDDTFALCHYAQNYAKLGELLDFICPMSYHVEYKKPPEWPSEIARNTENKTGKPAYAGIGAFGNATVDDVLDAITQCKKQKIHGFVLFRYGTITDEMWNALNMLVR